MTRSNKNHIRYVQLDFWDNDNQRALPWRDSSSSLSSTVSDEKLLTRLPTSSILTLDELEIVQERLIALSGSEFRNSFRLGKKEREYIRDKGLETIERHARDFIQTRLAPAVIPNDGKQTPMRGHPVFLAQHASGTCCRTCLHKWHRIEPGSVLTQRQQAYVVAMIMAWIQKQLKQSSP